MLWISLYLRSVYPWEFTQWLDSRSLDGDELLARIAAERRGLFYLRVVNAHGCAEFHE